MNSKKLIIDTNILLLFIIGYQLKGQYISKSKRLQGYTLEDYNILIEIIKEFEKIYITPYIVTEVSNLIDLHGDVRTEIFKYFELIIQAVEIIDIDVKNDANGDYFHHFGITDHSLIKLIKDYTIITNDRKLTSVLNYINHKNVICFDDYRQ